MSEVAPAHMLRSAGLQVTGRRTMVLELLVGRERPVTAQQLYADLQRSGTRIGLTTVYRALHVLAEAGLLHVFDSGGETAYRLCGSGGHHHLVCRVCGLVTEGPPVAGFDRWLARIPAEYGFIPERHRIEIFGVCTDCRP
jgi:Fur family ferric uptake transcriptional regulator